ncbi:MAG: HAD family phosphatase [Micropruina sp.]|uniref:HAD family hydrolase n=1 Tax=Micropruina sp. TaxID=2737536 RepID=UPI0039E3D651
MRRPESIHAAVFDFDGLLADTEGAWGELEGAMFTSRGRDYGVAEREMFLGMSVGGSAQVMAEVFGEDPAAVLDEVIRRAIDTFRAGVTTMPGAQSLLRTLSATMPVAIASNSSRVILDAAIEASGLAGLASAVVAGDEVPQAKPAPDIYLRACELLDVPPHRAIAFEDSPTGARAARAAGLYLVAVPAVEGSIADADLIVPSLTDPRIEELLSVVLRPC